MKGEDVAVVDKGMQVTTFLVTSITMSLVSVLERIGRDPLVVAVTVLLFFIS